MHGLTHSAVGAINDWSNWRRTDRPFHITYISLHPPQPQEQPTRRPPPEDHTTRTSHFTAFAIQGQWRRKAKKGQLNLRPVTPQESPTMNGEIAPPEMPDIWQESDEFKVHFLVHTPWEWVMDQLPAHTMVRATSNAELPSSRVPPEATPGITTGTPASRRRRQHRKGLLPCTLKLDFVNPSTGEVDFAVHGTSAALDGVEDKDELVRTIQRCQCVEQNLCPPSVLINWDATKEECLNVVGNELPSLVENTQTKTIAVLKEPMGSQGQGIYFVQSVSEIHEIIDEHHKRANEDPGFLQHLIEVKGRIPSWGKYCNRKGQCVHCIYRLIHRLMFRQYSKLKLSHPCLFETGANSMSGVTLSLSRSPRVTRIQLISSSMTSMKSELRVFP